MTVTICRRRHVAFLAVVLTATLTIAGTSAGLAASPWGVRAGVASSDLHSGVDSDAARGTVLGVWFRSGGHRVGFSLEVLYVRQGCRNIVQGGGYTFEGGTLIEVRQDIVLDYMQLPLLVHVRLPGTTMRMMAGPAVGFLLDSKAIFVDDARSEIYWGLDGWVWWTPVGSLDHVPHADASLWLGIAAETRVAGRQLGLAAHYQHGLRDLDPTVRTVRNRVVMVSMTVGL